MTDRELDTPTGSYHFDENGRRYFQTKPVMHYPDNGVPFQSSCRIYDDDGAGNKPA